MGTKRIVVVPDMQIPAHDPKAVENLVSFVSDYQPDELVNVGDDADATEVAFWTKGTAGEYAGTLQDSFDLVRNVHYMFRMALGNKPYHVSRSNHGDRLSRYIRKHAPALGSLRSLELPELLGYRDYRITYHEDPFEIAPGWVCAHGDEGTISAIAGRTAGLLAEKWGVSVVCGHTHRAGLSQRSYGFSGTVTRTVAGLEVGHLMDMSQASYLKGGHGNWQQAFGILYVTANTVTPVLVPVHAGGRFVVEGTEYGN